MSAPSKSDIAGTLTRLFATMDQAFLQAGKTERALGVDGSVIMGALMSWLIATQANYAAAASAGNDRVRDGAMNALKNMIDQQFGNEFAEASKRYDGFSSGAATSNTSATVQ